MSPGGYTSRHLIEGDGAALEILQAIRTEFAKSGFRVVDSTPDSRVRLRSSGFWRGTAANLLPVELFPQTRAWGVDAVVDAVLVDASRVELSARGLLPRALAVPIYEQALAAVDERLRAAGLAVEIGPELEP